MVVLHILHHNSHLVVGNIEMVVLGCLVEVVRQMVAQTVIPYVVGEVFLVLVLVLPNHHLVVQLPLVRLVAVVAYV